MKKKPYYRAYVVEDLGEDESFWTLVGSAFAHTDHKGFTVLLKALPTDGRLVLRRYSEAKLSLEDAVSVRQTEAQGSTK